MSVYESFLKPLLFRLPAETAHELGIRLLRAGLGAGPVRSAFARKNFAEGPWPIERFGLSFPNPLGVAAGFDKNGKAAGQLSSLGFGFVEIGTVTLEPQEGNSKPRLFRLPKDQALINRLGFNNEGAREIRRRLERARPNCVLGINIGRNKEVLNSGAVANYLATFELLQPFADYVAVNVSSPNTPGLRDLQEPEALDKLLSEIQARNAGFEEQKPLLLKIAPDLTEEGIASAVDTAVKNRVAGIIATNTTTGREGLTTSKDDLERIGAGGLSGKPIAGRSCEVISSVFRHARGRLEVIGVGGIFSGEDAFAKIAAGASLLQAYTGFIYRGPGFAKQVNERLAEILENEGFETIDSAVGSGAGQGDGPYGKPVSLSDRAASQNGG